MAHFPPEWVAHFNRIFQIDFNLLNILKNFFEDINNQYTVDEPWALIDLISSKKLGKVKEQNEFNRETKKQNQLDTVETENLSLLAEHVEKQLKENAGEQYEKALEETKAQLGQWWEDQLPPNITSDEYLTLYTASTNKSVFENALDQETWEKLDGITLLPVLMVGKSFSTASININELNSPVVIDSIKWDVSTSHRSDLDASIGNVESYKLSFGENALLDWFSNIVIDDGEYPVIDTIKAEEITKAIGLKDAQAEAFIQGLFAFQLQDRLSETELAENQSSIVQATDLVVSLLHQQSTKNTIDTAIQSYTDMVTAAMGNLGDDFQTDISNISYTKDNGLSVPISIQGVPLPSPVNFDTQISWPALSVSNDPAINTPAIYDANASYVSNTVSIQDFIKVSTTIDKKQMIKQLKDNPNANPIAAFSQLEKTQLSKSHSQLNSNPDQLKLQLSRQLGKLKLTANSIKFGGYSPESTNQANENSTNHILQHLDQQRLDPELQPDQFAVVKAISQTQEYLSSSEMDQLGDTLERFSAVLSSNRTRDNNIKDVLIQNINSATSDKPMFESLQPFVRDSVSTIAKVIDVDALEDYVRFLESPTSKEMNYMDYLHQEGKVSPSSSVYKNFITHYNSIADQQEQDGADPFLDKALEELDA